MNVLEKILEEIKRIEEMNIVMMYTVSCFVWELAAWQQMSKKSSIPTWKRFSDDSFGFRSMSGCQKFRKEQRMFICRLNVHNKWCQQSHNIKMRPDGTWFDDSGEVYNVIAWQPLAKQLEGGENNGYTESNRVFLGKLERTLSNRRRQAYEAALEALEKQLPKEGIKEKITEGIHKGLHNFYLLFAMKKET